MTTFAIVNFTGFRKNWGCQSTSWELMKWLTDVHRDGPRLPQPRITPLLPVTGEDFDLNETLPGIYADIGAVAAGTRGAPASRLERLCRDRFGPWMAEIEAADVVYFQGEGTLMGGGQFHYGARHLLLPFVAKTILDKPVVSLNQTIFLCDPGLTRTARTVFNCFDANLSREPASTAQALDIGIERLREVPDTAFLTRAEPTDIPLPERYFCVTGTAYRQKGAGALIYQLVKRLAEETGREPVFIASKDKALTTAAQKHHSQITEIDATQSYQDVAHVLSGADFLIGGRYHMAIVAAAVGTPTILLRGNSPKNEGLAQMFGTRTFDLTDEAGVLAEARSILGGRPGPNPKVQRAQLDAAGELLAGGRVLDLPHPDATPISDALMAEYCEVATTGLGKTRPPDATTKAERFGRVPTAEDWAFPYVSGLQGDRHRSLAGLAQVRARFGDSGFDPGLNRTIDGEGFTLA